MGHLHKNAPYYTSVFHTIRIAKGFGKLNSLKGLIMNETHLARLESTYSSSNASSSSYSPGPTNGATNKAGRWYFHIEASCWLLLNMHAPELDLIFCLEYADSLKKHSVVIDRAKVGYLRDSLMTGSFAVEGFGEFRDARLVLISDEANAPVDVRSIRFDVVRSSDTVKPKYRLVA